MKLTEVPIEKANSSAGKWGRLVEEFIKADIEAAEVEDFNCTIQNAYSGMRNYIIRHELPVVCRMRSGKLYIMKAE